VDDIAATKADITHQHFSTDISNFDNAVRISRLDQMAVPTNTLNINN
jgi:hypothetical protein